MRHAVVMIWKTQFEKTICEKTAHQVRNHCNSKQCACSADPRKRGHEQHDAPAGENRSHEIYNFQNSTGTPSTCKNSSPCGPARASPRNKSDTAAAFLLFLIAFANSCGGQNLCTSFTVDLVCLRMGVDINAFIEMAPEGKTIECD